MQKSMVCKRFTCTLPHSEWSTHFSCLKRISHVWKPILQQTEFGYLSWFGNSRRKWSIHRKFHGRNLAQQVIHRKGLLCFLPFNASESFSFRNLFSILTIKQPTTAALSHHQKICDTNFAEPAISNIKHMRNDALLWYDDDDQERLVMWSRFTWYVHKNSAICYQHRRNAVAPTALQIALWDFRGCGIIILSTIVVKSSSRGSR